MAQPSNNILNETMLNKADYRNQFIEVATSADDFASGEVSLLLSTVPFLPIGDSFPDIPLYPVGLTQSISYNEGASGQFLPEVGSSRKINTKGTSYGSGSISRLVLHGNSLVAALYRPAIPFLKSSARLDSLHEKMFSTSTKKDWLKGMISQDIDIYSAETTKYVDRVITAGGLNSLLYHIPFGLIEVRRDPRQRCIAINFMEQCAIRGSANSQSAGQFQLVDSLSFEFERLRPLNSVGSFILSNDSTRGI